MAVRLQVDSVFEKKAGQMHPYRERIAPKEEK